jgi:hypothetical protein
MIKIHILCPTYMDSKSLKLLIENLEIEILNIRELNYELFFWAVDDSAGLDVELRNINNLKILLPRFNLGHARALVFGLRKLAKEISDDDLVVTMDSDGEDRPEDVPNLINDLIQNSKDIIAAKRTKRSEGIFFKIFYFAFKVLFRILTGKVICSGNFVAWRGKYLIKIINHPYFDLSYSSSVVVLTREISYVPCERGSRYFGKSKMNFTSLIMHGLRMLMPFLDVITVRALIFFSIFFGISITVGLIIIYFKTFTYYAIPGWSSQLLSMMIILSTVCAGNFFILFTLYSQSSGAGLRNIERDL